MPKRWVTLSVCCTSSSQLWLLLSFLFLRLTCRFHVLCFLRAACQWSGQRPRSSMEILQNFPAKVTCMYFFRSNYKIVSFFSFFTLFFLSGRIIFPRETFRESIWFSISRVACAMQAFIATDQTWPNYLWSENLNKNRADCLALTRFRHQRNLQRKESFHCKQK